MRIATGSVQTLATDSIGLTENSKPDMLINIGPLQPHSRIGSRSEYMLTNSIDNPTFKTAALERLRGLRESYMPTDLVDYDRRIIRTFPSDFELENRIALTNEDPNLLFFLLPAHFSQLRDSLITQWQKFLDCVHNNNNNPCFHQNKIPFQATSTPPCSALHN